MKITQIETLSDGHCAVVCVRTDGGAEGVGQTAPHQVGVTVKVLHELLAPHFLGENPWDLEALVWRCLQRTYKYRGTFLYRALCGIDTALWDLLGKLAGQPVYRLLGGAVRSEVPVYGSSMARHTSPDEEAAVMQEAVARFGFQALKIKIGGRMSQDADAAPGRTEGVIQAVREAVGSEVKLMADANGSYSPGEAVRVGRVLEHFGYSYFEEPCPYYDREATRKVRDKLDIPLCGAEQDNDLGVIQSLIGNSVLDMVQPDVGYIGGLCRARKVAALAEVAGVPLSPHSATLTLLLPFSLHLAAATPAAFWPCEYRLNPDDWMLELYDPLPEVVGGTITLTEAPGWGVTLKPAFLKRAERQRSSL